MAGNSRGFTLLEVLTALAIASIILLAVTGTLFALNSAHSKATERMQQQRALRSTVDLLRREISSALYQPADKLLRFQVQDRDFYNKPASTLSLVTLAPPLDGEISDQIVVQYKAIEQGEQIKLTRSSRDFFQQETDKLTDWPLLERLEGFLVECYDGSKWVRTWDTELNRALPKQVRVTVTIPDSGKPVSFQLLATPRIERQ